MQGWSRVVDVFDVDPDVDDTRNVCTPRQTREHVDKHVSRLTLTTTTSITSEPHREHFAPAVPLTSGTAKQAALGRTRA